jgi:hypothetical protein
VKKALTIGTANGKPFTLPLDVVARTQAIVAIRGAGKTVAATVLAEEMCEAGLPWIAFDPVGVWWGLRVNPDGTPGGYPVLVVGGQHGDLPLDKDQAPQLAEALVRENVCCVIDMKLESKNVWRAFVADFCDRLMELQPSVPKHLFFEEAPELVPQRPMGEQKRSRAAVDRLIRLGRNQGYGGTLISQRFATVDKDVLTQCENLFAMRSIGKPDRDAARDWIAECVSPEPGDTTVKEFLDSLTDLPDGTGWFWSPQWLNQFEQVKIRARKTYHPGATRVVGQEAKQVELSDVGEFVDRFRTVLQAKPIAKPRTKPDTLALTTRVTPTAVSEAKAHEAEEEAARLRGQVADLHRQLGAAKATITSLRQALEPQYRAMQKLFAELDSVAASPGGDPTIWESWRSRLPGRAVKILDVLIQRGEATRDQIAVLSGISRSSSNLDNGISELNRAGLIDKDGKTIRLRQP